MVEPNQENNTECSLYRDPEHHSRPRVSRRMEAGYTKMPCSRGTMKESPCILMLLNTCYNYYYYYYYYYYLLLTYDAMKYDVCLPTFRGNILPPFSG
jgi:hypothetical protein